MTIADTFTHLLHPRRDKDSWPTKVSDDPSGCWACKPGTPGKWMCASCQLRASARAAVEGAFPVFDPASSTTLRGLKWN